MKETTNYALKKMDLTDNPPDITVINPNWDTIDTKLKENANAIETHLAENASLTVKGHVQLGSTASTAAPGNHNHSGVYSPVNHNHSGVYEPVLPAENKRKITYGTATPTILAEGEIYFQYE